MADHLAYWKTFWEYGPPVARSHVCDPGYGSDQEDILDRLAPGDHVWIVGRSRDDQGWRLLQRLTLARIATDAEERQRMVANPATSVFFDPDTQGDFEPQLIQLQFDPRNPITATGKLIGRNIQRIRHLSDLDVDALEAYAALPSNAMRQAVPAEENHPETLSERREYFAGAVRQVLVNQYERDPIARAACLKRHGYRCAVCNMSFEERYGEIGKDFIHVHHKKPLATCGEEYRIDPERDLVPVCPNCHAMLHTTEPPRTVDELRSSLAAQGTG